MFRYCFTAIMLVFLAVGPLLAQKKHLQSGPMVGYADMREVALWAQTNRPAKVYFTYREAGKGGKMIKTAVVKTEAGTGYTARCIADQVEPGRTYEYTLHINGGKVKRPYPLQFRTQPLWQYRTDPPEFSVATGSCMYDAEEKYDRPGKPYGSEYFIFDAIVSKKPDLMLWLGDNYYYREPDWATRTGMLHRATHARSLPELQPLLAACSHYAVWDDHDYGPNDSDGAWPHKETAQEVFESFWANPTSGLPGQPGITSFFQYGGIDFFLLDNRYFRTPNNCESCPRTLLGAEQLAWLKAGLSASYAPYKVVALGGQVLTTNDAHETYLHLFPAERDDILAHIEHENIKGVVFLNGDRHFSELSEMTNAKGNKVWDVTCSSLTAGSFTDAATKTQNTHRVEGTVIGKHNFALLTFSGPQKERMLTVRMYDNTGGLIWEKRLER